MTPNIFPIDIKKFKIINNLPLYYQGVISQIIEDVQGKDNPKINP